MFIVTIIIPNLYREFSKTNNKLILVFLNFVFVLSNILGILTHCLRYDDYSSYILNIFTFYFHLVMLVLGVSGIMCSVRYKNQNYENV
jgi:hypothetical protein